MNLRPSGYEPDELPGCSTPRRGPVGPKQDWPQAGRRPIGPKETGLRQAAWRPPGSPPLRGPERSRRDRWPVGPERNGLKQAAMSAFGGGEGGGGWIWRRPTLPRLETQYHGRGGVSRPSSEWGRVGHPRYRPPDRSSTPAAPDAVFARAGGPLCGGARHRRRGGVARQVLAWVPLRVCGGR